MSKIVVLSGHPNSHDSVANKNIMETLGKLLPEADLVQLDQLYPEARFDVSREQQRLVNADIIVLQSPVYWHSVSGLLKMYIEQVFDYGFANGSKGNALHGKKILVSLMVGGPENMYANEDMFDMETCLYSIKHTAIPCGLEWEGYFYTTGYEKHVRGKEKPEELIANAKQHAQLLTRKIKNLINQNIII